MEYLDLARIKKVVSDIYEKPLIKTESYDLDLGNGNKANCKYDYMEYVQHNGGVNAYLTVTCVASALPKVFELPKN